MANDALNLNPPVGDFHISTHGSDWLWAAFSVNLFSLLIMVALHFTKPRGSRLFHQLAIIVLTTTSISYFSMASDLGNAPATVEFRDHGATLTRQVWYVRYIQWIISLPIILLELLLTTGLSVSDIVTTIFMAVVFIVAGLVGSLVPSTYKWGYFVFGIAALFYIWYVLLWQGPRATFADGALQTAFTRSASYLAFFLMLYPISWALSEGGNVISPTSEMIFYGILDIFTGPVLLFLFVFHLRSVDYEVFGLHAGKYTDHGGRQTSASAKAVEAGEARA